MVAFKPTDKSVSIAQIVIYAILVVPAHFCLFRHGRQGILGWLSVVIFCVIRLVGEALALNDDHIGTSSTGALIVENVGLSPLILAAAGILHEARHVRNSIRNTRVEWIIVIQYHVLVSAGLGCLAAGIGLLMSTNPVDSDWILLKVGFAIIFLCWCLLVAATLWSFRRPTEYNALNKKFFAEGTILLNAVFFSLPMILLRSIYGAINLFGSDKSSFSSNLAADICMSVIPPMLAIILFIMAGVKTHRLGSTTAITASKRSEYPEEVMEFTRVENVAK